MDLSGTVWLKQLEELQKGNAHMKNPQVVENLISAFIDGGKEQLQVVTDFDQTITKYQYNDTRCNSSADVLDHSPLLPQWFKDSTEELREKYYPTDLDVQVVVEDKTGHMIEWYTKSLELFATTKSRKSDFKKMVAEDTNIFLRDGMEIMLEFLQEIRIPILIVSAGIGDMIEALLKYWHVFYGNMTIIANYLDYDESGYSQGFKKDIIHQYNKHEQSDHQNADYENKMMRRTNVILMGDSLGDLRMKELVKSARNILTIGFLNEDNEEKLSQFMDNYHIVLVDEQSVDLINGILQNVYECGPQDHTPTTDTKTKTTQKKKKQSGVLFGKICCSVL